MLGADVISSFPVLQRILSLIEEVKESVNDDLSEAIEDLDAATPFFEALDELQSLSAHLSDVQKELLGLAQAVRQSLEVHGPFVNSVLESSGRIHNLASTLNDQSFLVTEDVKMLSTNLSIASKEELVVRKKIAHMEGELRLLQKWKRELDDSISADVFKLINKNRTLRGLEARQRLMMGRLDEINDVLEKADRNRVEMSEILEAARDAVRRC
ncbi:hypothetical protein A2U01_0010923 [Trifolium medium]|uniref:Uncharacterized protein n=1 Tax=Trifolium medium TaxID=97028 RepID=A0A392MR77_9FABA|nr:hypothetical protein [Trifolium medium]